MDHTELIRDVPGSRVAVLMIHGIAGTPAHFRALVPVIPKDWTLRNIILDGHGKQVRDFGASSMEKWRSQALSQVEQLLQTHDKLILIAHSMGTLFSIQAALQYPERIPFLFLLNVPTRPWVRFSTMLTCMRVRKGPPRDNDRAGWDMYNATCIRLEPELWKYMGWLPRLLELLVEIRKVRKLLPQLKVPSYAFQSEVDELVATRSMGDLQDHPYIKATLLRDSGHFQYGKADTQQLVTCLTQLIKDI